MKRELMIHVERAVRPVRAALVTKMRMREELYALLHDIYEQEQAAHADDAQSVAAAIERFGSAARLTDELQQSVPRHEVCEAAIDRAIMRRENEGIVRHAARLAGVTCLYLAVLGPVAFGIRIMLVERPVDATSFILASLLMALAVFGAFTVTLLGHLLFRCIQQTRNVASWLGIVGIPLLTGLLVLASIPMLVAATTGELQPALTMVNVTAPVAVFGILLMPAVALLAAREQRKVEPWQALVLTETSG